MADVRALLRTEQAARRITDPRAEYVKGRLHCGLCRVRIRSEAEWEKHCESEGHVNEARREASLGKKRKAAGDEQDGEDKKRLRVEEDDVEEVEVPAEDDVKSAPAPQPSVDEQEWAAFENDLVTSDTIEPAAAKLTAAPTISAAPTTAAAQATVEATAPTKTSAAAAAEEAEAEREEAARALEDEFDTMASLEQRVKQLREKRERLRQASTQDTTDRRPSPLPPPLDDDDDDDDDDDGWTFGTQ